MSSRNLYVVIDLEATCWQRGTSPARMETIEIGAVKLAGRPLEPNGEFGMFVRPVDEPVLSKFCTDLTTITQADVEAAPDFPEAFGRFMEWVGPEAAVLCSWGNYDRRQIEVDCRRHGLAIPPLVRSHVNLKRLFAERQNRKPCGMRRALSLLSLDLQGVHHRGLDDARNIARIAARILEPGEESTR